MHRKLVFIALSLFCFHGLFSANSPDQEKLLIGAVFSPPYIFIENGKPAGVCIDLWKLVSDTLNISNKIIFYANHDSLLNDLKTGKIDLSICPYTATTERLQNFRLTIPFYISNMGIVSKAENQRPLLQVFKHIFSWIIIRWLVIVLVIVSVFAFFLWLAERRENSLQFHPGAKGVLDGVWWAFVTMTTVGYGDKIPKTYMGKILAITWMFFAIGLFFVASGVVSSELTLNKLQSRVRNSSDLTHCRVGGVAHSGYTETLLRQGIDLKLFKTPESAFAALAADSIDAFVYDLGLLNYVVDRYGRGNNVVVIPSGLNLQYFSFLASKENTGLVDKVNLALLSAIDDDLWEDILSRYGLNK
jgi:polar amino acid transport system substrate-binding protein